MPLNVGLEIERLENLITGFGWEKTKEEKTEEKLIVTIEKDIDMEEKDEKTK